MSKIKEDMMELWKETFHDSDRYVEIVFDNYFTPDNVFTHYDENRLISALLCVPYEFQILAEGRGRKAIKALYLCGLATRNEYRGQGIMSQLMEAAEESAKLRNYDMTFLIPADRHLREYYGRKGYRNASFRKAEWVDSSGFTSRTNLNIYSIHDLCKRQKKVFIEQLADWCVNIEKEEKESSILIHSTKDMIAVIEENENSIFITDGTFDMEKPILAKVVAVVFPELKDQDAEEYVTIVGEYLRSHSQTHWGEKVSENKISKEVTAAIGSYFSGKKIKRIVPYSGFHTPQVGEEPYAMVKYLDSNENFPENHNLIFKISLMLD